MPDQHEACNPPELLSVVVPVYNEEAVIREFHGRLASVINSLRFKSEVIYVNDGSTDASLPILEQMRADDTRIAIIDLSRNFGKEIALSAGLDFASGDVVIVIDADLQDPPELIPEFISYWEKGFDVVYGRRAVRDGETPMKKFTAYAFYRLMQNVSKVKLPPDAGDYRLLSRRAVESLRTFREQHRFMKGLFAWIGYSQKEVLYRRDPRHGGNTKWNYWRLWNFALDGITSFTIFPLKLASYLGIITALGAFCFATVVIYKTLVYGDPVAGYPSLMVVILFLGGVQLIALGVAGEYIGRIFNESKHRPLYFVNRFYDSQTNRANRTPSAGFRAPDSR